MKKIMYLLMTALLCISCEDFLDTESLTKKNTGSFPTSEDEATQMVSGIYAMMNSTVISPINTYFFLSELASDDRFGGGGNSDKGMQSLDKLMKADDNQFSVYWSKRYAGIFRANFALENLDKCEISEDIKNRYKGEAYFLRAFFYHELAEMFGAVPLTLSTEPVNIPRTQVDILYGQIAYDLKQAIELLPNTPWNTVLSGRVTRWAAQGLLARVYLFYTGFYNQEENRKGIPYYGINNDATAPAPNGLPLTDGEGQLAGNITKEEVIKEIEECIAKSGHSLVEDFRLLWPYSNEKTAKDYDFVKDLYANQKTWVKDGTNPEHVFVLKFSTAGDAYGFSNLYNLHFAIRSGADNIFGAAWPLGRGWGAGPVNPDLWNKWSPDDKRRQASIYHMTVSPADTPHEPPLIEGMRYSREAGSQVEETDCWQKKYTNICAKDADGKLVTAFSLLYGVSDDFRVANVQDLCLIRYADVLLMEAELKGTYTDGWKEIRKRAYPDASKRPATSDIKALQDERRYELAFEGRRWADIRRWGIAPTSLSVQDEQTIYNVGVGTSTKEKNFGGGYAARYNATLGFFSLPVQEIDLSEGVLVQNPGWEDAMYPGW